MVGRGSGNSYQRMHISSGSTADRDARMVSKKTSSSMHTEIESYPFGGAEAGTLRRAALLGGREDLQPAPRRPNSRVDLSNQRVVTSHTKNASYQQMSSSARRQAHVQQRSRSRERYDRRRSCSAAHPLRKGATGTQSSN